MTNGPARLLTISQAAARLGIHQNTLRTWADKGIVPHVKLPSGYRRFEPDEIERLRDRMRVSGADEAKMIAAQTHSPTRRLETLFGLGSTSRERVYST